MHWIGCILNLLSVAAVVKLGSILAAELWTFRTERLSDAVVKSTSVASFKTNLSTADLSRFLTIV